MAHVPDRTILVEINTVDGQPWSMHSFEDLYAAAKYLVGQSGS